jgi:hypothetical protein
MKKPRRNRRRVKAVREMMAERGFTPLDAIEFLSNHSVSLNRGAQLNAVVFACRAFMTAHYEEKA